MPWSQATAAALYGLGGFFHRPEGPAGHFRTSVHATPLFAAAVLELLREVDAGLDHPGRLNLVDVGAGRGELVSQVLAALAAGEAGRDQDLAGRLRVTAVEVAGLAAPAGPAAGPDVVWTGELPEDVTGLLMANEWLDDVPLDVVEATSGGAHRVLVEPATGSESPGGPVGLKDAGWLVRWWPLDAAAAGDRAEVGLSRDAAWAAAVGTLRAGVAVAVDYGHLRADRALGRYAAGTLTGYRDGRAVPPVPDGSCDLTAHVAVDACAQAGQAAGATSTALLRQREVLHRLGLTAALPDVGQASTDPLGYARALAHASAVAELVDPAGLGGFWWLAQSVGIVLPPSLRPGPGPGPWPGQPG